MAVDENLKNIQEQYLAKDFDKSIEILTSLKDKFDPGVYFYNLGTINIKKGNLAEGRFYLEKAKESGYYNTHVINNIEKTKELLGIVELERPESVSDFVNFYSMSLDANLFLTFSLFILVILTFLFKKLNWGLRVFFVVLALIPVSFKLYFVDNLVKAVPLADIEVFEGPSKVFDKTNILNKGLLVKVINKQEDWSYIIYPNKLQGWIKTSELKVVKE